MDKVLALLVCAIWKQKKQKVGIRKRRFSKTARDQVGAERQSSEPGRGSKARSGDHLDPIHFEEVRDYVEHLKKHPLIVRLNHLELDEARRIVDFMSGATYAIDGNMRKLADMIFFFAPQSVTIEGR